jgi:hypothetical protein
MSNAHHQRTQACLAVLKTAPKVTKHTVPFGFHNFQSPTTTSAVLSPTNDRGPSPGPSSREYDCETTLQVVNRRIQIGLVR